MYGPYSSQEKAAIADPDIPMPRVMVVFAEESVEVEPD